MSTARAPDIETPRLVLVAWSLPVVDAMIAGDAALLSRSLDVSFPQPFRPPPGIDDALQFFRGRYADDPDAGGWPDRLILRREDRMVVGSAGIFAPGAEDGACALGYGVYPEFEGRGYASEAAAALVAWAFGHRHAASAVAAILPANIASQRVAAKAGLTFTGRTAVEDEGEMQVWERIRPDQALAILQSGEDGPDKSPPGVWR
ncbi:MAG: GNAT family N-acetyltransferase [Thermomicrobiales bacterium]